MNELKNKILSSGLLKDSDLLNVDSFISGMVDPALMKEAGCLLAKQYAAEGVTKVLTIETSGIVPALYAAEELQVPLVILKKHASGKLTGKRYQTEVNAAASERTYELTLAEGVMDENDHVLIVDDFLSDGEAISGAVRLIRMVHATTAGVGVLIEKCFQPGREKLLSQGIKSYALCEIASIADGVINFK